MQHAAAVGVGDGVADVNKAAQQCTQLHGPLSRIEPLIGALVEAGHRLLQAVAADETHGVVGPAVRILAQAVDRHDARVLQAAGDLGLQEEAGAAVGIVGMPFLDLLECHFAPQFLVAGHGDLPQPSFGMRPEDAEAAPRRGGTADGLICWHKDRPAAARRRGPSRPARPGP